MRKLIISLMAIVSAMSVSIDAQALSSRNSKAVEKSQIAVYVTGDADKCMAEAISSQFTNWLVKVPCFTLLARDGACLNTIVGE